MKLGLLHTAMIISKTTKGNSNVIAGGFALSMYYHHRIPHDIDVWNYNDNELLPLKIKSVKKVNKWLNRLTTTDGVNIDTVRPGHILNRILYQPVYIDLIKVLDIRDLLAHTVHSIVSNHKPVKKTAYVDLYYIMKDFTPAQILEEYKKHYPEDKKDVAKALIAFNNIKNEPNPELIVCNCVYAKALQTIKSKFE